MFAWFDACTLSRRPSALWCSDLAFYRETASPAEGRTLLDDAEQTMRRADPGIFVFALDFECAPWFEPALAPAFRNRPPGILRLWRFRLHEWLKASEAETRARSFLAETPELLRTAGFLDWRAGCTKTEYRRAFARIQYYLREGHAYQVNYAFPWHVQTFGNLLALYLRLHAHQPVPHGAYLPMPNGGAILCRSPELFVARHGSRLKCRPMKGTAPPVPSHTCTAATEKHGPGAWSSWLDEKTRAENVMIVDLIRNDLARLTPPGRVRVKSLFSVEHYATLQQLTSTIVAEPIEAGLWEVLRALFPCGSVTGAPKKRVIEIITELEREPRGVYCGAIGYLLPGGDFRLIVPIRTVVVAPDGRASLWVGSGILSDSNPDHEWAECLMKASFARGLPSPVGLIETLRWHPERGCDLWSFHCKRMAGSAKALGISWSQKKFRQSVLRAVKAAESKVAGTTSLEPSTDPSVFLRVRVELGANGTVRAEAVPCRPPTLPVRFGIVQHPVIDESDPLQRLKTTRRFHYDSLLAEASARGWYDAVVCNRQGELVEGARSAVFVRFPGSSILYTPPLSSGALNSVIRKALIGHDQAAERVLYPRDLIAAEAIFLGNALHGLLPAVLDESSSEPQHCLRDNNPAQSPERTPRCTT